MKISRHIPLLGYIALLAVSAVGYSAWSSSIDSPQSTSTVTAIPPASNLTVTTQGSSYLLSWIPPSGTDYNGKAIAQYFEVQASSTGTSGSWTTLAVVPGTQATYTAPVSTSDAYFRIVTYNHGWVSTYVGSNAGGPIQKSPPAVITEQIYNPPPNYCINPNTGNPQYANSTKLSGPTYICEYPNNAGYVAEPVSGESDLIWSGGGTAGAFQNGQPVTSNNPLYGFIGMAAPASYEYLPNPSPPYAVYTDPNYPQPPTNGILQFWPYCQVDYYGQTYGADCPSRTTTLYLHDPSILPTTSFAGVKFVILTISSGFYYYHPSCADYPTSASAPNFSQYVATCVTPYDSSYQEYSSQIVTVN